MAIEQGAPGNWKYQHEHDGRRMRINWQNPPPPGEKLIDRWYGVELTVVDIGFAGMIHATDAEGVLNAFFPWDVEVPNAIDE